MRTFILPLLLAALGMFAQIGRAVPIITAVVETGGDNEATDTIAAKWTGATFPVSVANEPVPGAVIGNSYTVGVFGNQSPTFVDRNHRYTSADPAVIPAYLLGGEYIMSGNDNRDNATYRLDVTVGQNVVVYMLIDNRLGDADGATPPTFDATHMQWILDSGWAPVTTGVNRTGDSTRPDEVGIDEGADGTINQYYSIYSKSFPAGTFTLLQADNTGQNMYGAVVRQGAKPQLAVGLNFGADEPPAVGSSLAADAVAGAVPQANWNNLTLATGSAASIVADAAGASVPTTISVEWTSPNTWSSTGRGEENNGFAADTADRALMTGYIDTGNGPANTATVTVSGIPAEFTSGGYDVLVYGLGGVAGRGGAYTIGGVTKYGTSPANPTAHVEDPGVNVTDQGTYVRFRGQYGSSFTLVASADAALDPNLVNFRAPVNAIQIVRNSDPNAGLVRGYLTKVRYDNVGPDSILISDLLNHPKYINDQYDYICLRTDFSANDAEECNNCGLVVRGYFIPTASGPHTFYISADDQAVLFLSTDDSPANKVEIAREPEWAGRRNYLADGVGDGGGGRGDPPINRSAPINLLAGVPYYIEGAVKEAGGGDNLDVAVEGPGDPAVLDGDRPIFGDRIATKVDLTGSSLIITQNPVEVLRVPEGDTATFSVTAEAVSPLCGASALYQWQRNGVDIPGATSPTLTFGPVLPDLHLSKYRAVVRMLGIERISTEATLEVLGRECLRVVKATGSGALNSIGVQFSTFVSTDATTTDTFNYHVTSVADGSALTVNSAAISADGKSVILSTDPQTENTEYAVTVENVLSIVGSAVCEAPNNTASFRSWVSGPGSGVEFTLFTQVGGGTDIDILVNHPTFPNSPDQIRQLPTFDTGADIMDNYGGRVRGLFIPPVSGAWNLFVTADDGSRLFFNANGPDAAGKVLISQETPGCCTAFAGRKTGPFNLEAGVGYYLEGIYKEAGGGDYIRVAARLANDTTTPLAPMPPEWAGYPAAPAGVGGPINITQQPASQTVTENSLVTLSIQASNPNGLPIFYQWTRNGEDIAGANKPAYSFGPVTTADDGAIFGVKLALIGTSAVSGTATLTVVEDTTGPTLVSIKGASDLTRLVLQFSELITSASAIDTFNYVIGDGTGVSVVTATLGADGKTVTLLLSAPLTPDTTYQVKVSGIADLSDNTMTEVTVPVQTFAIKRGFALAELYLNIPGVLVTDLTGNPKYPSSPDITRYKGLLELNTFDEFENYGARMSGYIIPPVSGAYNFFMSSDDGGALYLSTDMNPANLVLIASEPVWNGRRDWLGTARRNAAAPENRSSTLFPSGIELTAGQMYYFEALVKEGGGGDNLAVTWQLPGAPLPASGSPALSGVYMASLVDPTGAAISITQQPVDQTSVIIPGQPTANVTFSVAVSASGPNAGNVFYQWMRDGGAGWQVVPGANSASYTFVPTSADNGAMYRAEVFVPGAEAVSTAATLTVAQVNTPPRFTAAPGDQNVLEDAGAQSVQWATDITAHSTGILPANFNSLPPGSELGGNAAIAGGILHLTDAINSQQSSFVTPASPTPIDSLTVTFRALIGGGTCCGDRTADGWSLTIGDVIVPVTFPVAAEEGAAQNSGFAVNFDSWDNAGTDEAPAVDVKVGGSVIAFQSFDGVREGGRAPAGPLITDPATGAPMSYKTGTEFTDVRIQLDPDGTLDVYFKGVRVIDNVQTGIPLPLTNARLAFGARTGGANDNHWIDDLLVVGSLNGEVVVLYPPQENPEPGQTVHFNVSNDNPSLFSVQPAVSPTGVLTYTPAPNANGSALVTVVAQDDGGTLGGGVDSSAPVTFRINVAPVNDCPTASGQAISVDAGATATIQLSGSDVEGNALTYNVAQGPAHGGVIIQSGTGAATYTPTAGYSGPDSFTFTVSDGTCASAPATVSITVRSTGNECPVAVAKVEPNVQLSVGQVGTIVIAGNNTNACLNLDGTGSTDADGDSLTYAWVLVLSDGSTVPLATGATATACLDVGTYTVRLLVDDGTCVRTADVAVEIITASEAVDSLIDKVNDSTIERKNKRPFIASLKAAGASFDRGSCNSASGQLGAFINKVRAQIAKDNPVVAADLIRLANAILASVDCPEEEQQ